jgi:hypothetical protein
VSSSSISASVTDFAPAISSSNDESRFDTSFSVSSLLPPILTVGAPPTDGAASNLALRLSSISFSLACDAAAPVDRMASRSSNICCIDSSRTELMAFS